MNALDRYNQNLPPLDFPTSPGLLALQTIADRTLLSYAALVPYEFPRGSFRRFVLLKVVLPFVGITSGIVGALTLGYKIFQQSEKDEKANVPSAFCGPVGLICTVCILALSILILTKKVFFSPLRCFKASGTDRKSINID